MTMRVAMFLLLTACVTDAMGNDPGPAPAPDPMMPVTLQLSGPGEVDELDGNGSPTCATQLVLSGTFKSAGDVDPMAGCQPDGTWTVQVTVGNNGSTSLPACSDTPSVPSSFTYTVAGSGHSTTITYSNKQSGESDSFAINGDNGICTGSFAHLIGTDQTVLHPATTAFGSGAPNN